MEPFKRSGRPDSGHLKTACCPNGYRYDLRNRNVQQVKAMLKGPGAADQVSKAL